VPDTITVSIMHSHPSYGPPYMHDLKVNTKTATGIYVTNFILNFTI